MDTERNVHTERLRNEKATSSLLGALMNKRDSLLDMSYIDL